MKSNKIKKVVMKNKAFAIIIIVALLGIIFYLTNDGSDRPSFSGKAGQQESDSCVSGETEPEWADIDFDDVEVDLGNDVSTNFGCSWFYPFEDPPQCSVEWESDDGEGSGFEVISGSTEVSCSGTGCGEDDVTGDGGFEYVSIDYNCETSEIVELRCSVGGGESSSTQHIVCADPDTPPSVSREGSAEVRGRTATFECSANDNDKLSLISLYVWEIDESEPSSAEEVEYVSGKSASATFEVDNLGLGDYSWRCKAKDGNVGSEGANEGESDVGSFEVVNDPVVNLIWPGDGANVELGYYEFKYSVQYDGSIDSCSVYLDNSSSPQETSMIVATTDYSVNPEGMIQSINVPISLEGQFFWKMGCDTRGATIFDTDGFGGWGHRLEVAGGVFTPVEENSDGEINSGADQTSESNQESSSGNSGGGSTNYNDEGFAQNTQTIDSLGQKIILSLFTPYNENSDQPGSYELKNLDTSSRIELIVKFLNPNSGEYDLEETHYYETLQINPDSVIIQVTSDPKQYNLRTDEIIPLDLNDDKINDLAVRLDSINGDNYDVLISSISQKSRTESIDQSIKQSPKQVVIPLLKVVMPFTIFTVALYMGLLLLVAFFIFLSIKTLQKGKKKKTKRNKVRRITKKTKRKR